MLTVMFMQNQGTAKKWLSEQLINFLRSIEIVNEMCIFIRLFSLLKELKPKGGQQQMSFQLLQGMLQLATKNKANIERALTEFLALAGQDNQRENVGAVLGMATAYMLLKQTPRARNQLKRVAKYSWNFEDAEHLERCWLLLADIYIQVLSSVIN